MYQVTFSDQSLAELEKLETLRQLEIADMISSLDLGALDKTDPHLGVFHRGRKKLYRLRAGDYRIYFTLKGVNEIFCEVILPQHSVTDFVYRTKLPLSEDQIIEQHASFWEYLDGLTSKTKKSSSKK